MTLNHFLTTYLEGVNVETPFVSDVQGSELAKVGCDKVVCGATCGPQPEQVFQVQPVQDFRQPNVLPAQLEDLRNLLIQFRIHF